FLCSASSTFVKTAQPFIIFYESGSIRGYVSTDVLNLTGLIYPKQGMGVANAVVDVFELSPADGIIGLGWPPLAEDGIVTPMQNQLDQLGLPLFTIWMDRHVKPQRRNLGGLITYGGYDTNNCESEMAFVPLSSQTYWQFTMDGFAFGDYVLNKRRVTRSFSRPCRIGAPAAVVSAIVKAIGAKYDCSNQMFTVPCTGAYPDMVFTIGGKAYSVPSTEYVNDIDLPNGKCVLTIFEMQSGGFGSDFILGDTWSRSFCNIYDIGNSRIGFAKARHTEI
ncbi:hypothetical protein PFISCL1PPCAC_20873, partial [Pristionchus fissidentatus]